MKMNLAMLAALVSAAALAGPAGKSDLVADGFPDWQGLSQRNYIRGRTATTPSDLRHKVTVVIDVEAGERLPSQMLTAAKLLESLVGRVTIPFGNVEGWMPPRDVIGVVSCWGGADHAEVEAAMAPKKNDPDGAKALAILRGPCCCVYDKVTFTGAPDSTGKRPYVYVMGPTGKTPLWQGPLKDGPVKEVRAAIAKGKKEMKGWASPWRPFFGNIPEPKFHPQLAKALEKAKTGKVVPLDPVAKSILPGVKAKDAEKAHEAQVLYDALLQTRGDMMARIDQIAGRMPHVAAADLADFLKNWPGERKNLAAAIEKIKRHPESEQLSKIYQRLKTWSDPEFTCKNASEAKKIVAELTKAKKSIAKLKDSKTIVVQDAAQVIDAKIDELVAVIPTRVAEK